MAGDRFQRSLCTPKDMDHCWGIVTDVERVSSWIGVVSDVRELSRLRRYEALLADRVGPISLKAQLSITVEVIEEGARVDIVAQGRDRQVNSDIKVHATLALAKRVGGGTVVTVDGDYSVRGKVAGMGANIVKRKAERMISEFFQGLDCELTGR